MKVSTASEVHEELKAAREKFAPFNSAHEGYAVLEEEMLELRQEVFWGPKMGEGRKAKMRAEAVQIAAMAIRFIEDVCDKR